MTDTDSLCTDTKSQTVDIWFVYPLPFSFKKLKKEAKKNTSDKKEHRFFSFEIEQYQNWKQGIYKHLACYWKQILAVLVWMSLGRPGGLLYDTSLETNSFYPFRLFSKQSKNNGVLLPALRQLYTIRCSGTRWYNHITKKLWGCDQ